MSDLIIDMTISLDGYVTAPGAGPGNGLGDDGLELHNWAIGDREPGDIAVLEENTQATGAVLMGRNTFDVVDAPDGWNAERHYGADREGGGEIPCFVVTHEPPPTVRLTDRMHIVTDGLASAIDQARAAAGTKDVFLMGGGELAASALREGLADRLQLHVAPMILGGGDPIFAALPRVRLTLEENRTVTTRNAVHLYYRVNR
jgi:dihydrofolate reductase